MSHVLILQMSGDGTHPWMFAYLRLLADLRIMMFAEENPSGGMMGSAIGLYEWRFLAILLHACGSYHIGIVSFRFLLG